MPYVQRDQTTRIVGVFANPQVGYAEEFVADDATDLLAFLNPIVDTNLLDQATLNAALAAEGSVVRALALVLLQEMNTIRTKLPTPLAAYTQAQLVAALKAKMR